MGLIFLMSSSLSLAAQFSWRDTPVIGRSRIRILFSLLRKFSGSIPIKIEKSTAIIENQKARGGRWEERKGGSLRPFLSFPFPSCPARLFSPSSESPYDTKRPLRRRECPIGDFLLPTPQPAHLCNNSVVIHYFSFSL